MTVELPSLDPIPADIEEHIKRILQNHDDPAVGDWLLELLQYSGHMSTGDDMRWRIVCVVWLTLVFNRDAGWTYLMWFNMNEPVMSGHVAEMLIEGIDNLDAHIQVANWLAGVDDENVHHFFKDFYPIPAQRKMQPLLARLIAHPERPETGVWLKTFCEGTVHNDGSFLRPWRLIASAWYASAFNPVQGLEYLRAITGNSNPLSTADNQLLMETADKINGTTALIQLFADCTDPDVRTVLGGFGHPNLAAVADTVLSSKPDYSHLAQISAQVATDVALFSFCRSALEQHNVLPSGSRLLDMACGPLAEQCLLFSSIGYHVTGVDLDIPPKFLPLSGAKQWFSRRSHNSRWQSTTKPYYSALGQAVGVQLKWNKADVKLADLTHLEVIDASVDAVICTNHLQHAPDVNALLSEVTRVLKPGGVFVGNIRPFATITGAFQVEPGTPWAHLRPATRFDLLPPVPVNKWREQQFKETIGRYLNIETWQPEDDPESLQYLTPEIQAELPDYSATELTCRQIFVVASKAA
jgi:SAM-dependent methyltransferase